MRELKKLLNNSASNETSVNSNIKSVKRTKLSQVIERTKRSIDLQSQFYMK